MLTLPSLRSLPLLPLITLALLAPIPACSDDDSSASTDGSSSSSAGPDPLTSSSTAMGSTAVADSGTGSSTEAPATDTDTGASTGPGGTTDDETTVGGTTDASGLEIAGQWLEEFSPGMGITHVIDEERWDQLSEFGDALFLIDSYDNAARNVVAQGDPANEFNPELWSRFDWTWDGDALYYCTAVFDAASAADALAAPASDAGDLAAGCSGFAWSLLQPIR